MYTEKLTQFKNIENLGGKVWEHAVMLDFAEQSDIKDCSMHCFHYQQLFELLFKHLLEMRTKYGAYSHTHKLNRLIAQLVEDTNFKTDLNKYEQLKQLYFAAKPRVLRELNKFFSFVLNKHGFL